MPSAARATSLPLPGPQTEFPLTPTDICIYGEGRRRRQDCRTDPGAAAPCQPPIAVAGSLRRLPTRPKQPGASKRRDNQLHRARLLEVRTQSPPPERCYGAGGEDGNFVAYINRWSAAMPRPNDLSRSSARSRGMVS